MPKVDLKEMCFLAMYILLKSHIFLSDKIYHLLKTVALSIFNYAYETTGCYYFVIF